MERLLAHPKMEGLDLATGATCAAPYDFGGAGPRVGVYDFGVKRNILRLCAESGLSIRVYPSSTPLGEIIRDGAGGILLSNGPGDPKDNGAIIEQIRRLTDYKPVFGVCLGYQLIALAVGGDTCKLRYGHRGGNHPVKDVAQGRTYITSQNHGYAVIPGSLPDNVEITHLNWNDRTLEGIRLTDRPVFGVQFHPEGSPGPSDTAYLFDRFIALMDTKRKGAN